MLQHFILSDLIQSQPIEICLNANSSFQGIHWSSKPQVNSKIREYVFYILIPVINLNSIKQNRAMEKGVRSESRELFQISVNWLISTFQVQGSVQLSNSLSVFSSFYFSMLTTAIFLCYSVEFLIKYRQSWPIPLHLFVDLFTFSFNQESWSACQVPGPEELVGSEQKRQCLYSSGIYCHVLLGLVTRFRMKSVCVCVCVCVCVLQGGDWK